MHGFSVSGFIDVGNLIREILVKKKLLRLYIAGHYLKKQIGNFYEKCHNKTENMD